MVAGAVGGGGEAILMLGQELWAVKRLATHLRHSAPQSLKMLCTSKRKR